MKLESLVIADQHAAVNTGFVHTARHTTKVELTRCRVPNLLEGSAYGWFDIGVKP